jgi:type I restriction enzyme M protein
MTEKQLLEQQFWKIADTLRGKMGADDFRDYILGFTFYKYLSEKMHTFADKILALDAVIGLPNNIFYGTGIPTCILVLKKRRENPGGLLFTDACQHFEKFGNQNRRRPEDIDRIVGTYRKWESFKKFSHVAALDEVEENDYNLNIPRYVDTFEEEEPVELAEVSGKLVALEKEMGETNDQIAGICRELGITPPF